MKLDYFRNRVFKDVSTIDLTGKKAPIYGCRGQQFRGLLLLLLHIVNRDDRTNRQPGMTSRIDE